MRRARSRPGLFVFLGSGGFEPGDHGEPELCGPRKVDVVPTLALVKDKRVVDRLEGRASAPAIERMLAPHLADELAVA